jgi:hypothetical protein
MASSRPSAAGTETAMWVTPVTSAPHSARKASEPARAPASLDGDVGRHVAAAHAAERGERERDRRVEVGAGAPAERRQRHQRHAAAEHHADEEEAQRLVGREPARAERHAAEAAQHQQGGAGALRGEGAESAAGRRRPQANASDAPVTSSGPASVSTKVSSAFAPVTDGFQANAMPGSISTSVWGVAITSREA